MLHAKPLKAVCHAQDNHDDVSMAIRESRVAKPRRTQNTIPQGSSKPTWVPGDDKAAVSGKQTFLNTWGRACVFVLAILLMVGICMISKKSSPTLTVLPVSSDEPSNSQESAERTQFLARRTQALLDRKLWHAKQAENGIWKSGEWQVDPLLFPRIFFSGPGGYDSEMTGVYVIQPETEHEGRYEYVHETNPQYIVKFMKTQYPGIAGVHDMMGWTFYKGDEIILRDSTYPTVRKCYLPIDAWLQIYVKSRCYELSYCIDHKPELMNLEETKYFTKEYQERRRNDTVKIRCDLCAKVLEEGCVYHCSGCMSNGFDICMECSNTERGKNVIKVRT